MTAAVPLVLSLPLLELVSTACIANGYPRCRQATGLFVMPAGLSTPLSEAVLKFAAQLETRPTLKWPRNYYFCWNVARTSYAVHPLVLTLMLQHAPGYLLQRHFRTEHHFLAVLSIGSVQSATVTLQAQLRLNTAAFDTMRAHMDQRVRQPRAAQLEQFKAWAAVTAEGDPAALAWQTHVFGAGVVEGMYAVGMLPTPNEPCDAPDVVIDYDTDGMVI